MQMSGSCYLHPGEAGRDLVAGGNVCLDGLRVTVVIKDGLRHGGVRPGACGEGVAPLDPKD